VTILVALVQASAALAHASLVRAEPADGAIVAEAPAALRLTFNEPVTPLTMRLIAPDGAVTMPKAAAQNTTVTVTPPALRRGTHVLSWRVVSADGHPVGGSLVFSVGEASAQPEARQAGDMAVRAAFWTTKLVIYAAIFFGLGGIFFRAWMMETVPAWLDRTLIAWIGIGLLAIPVSVGLQGLDALDLPLSGLARQSAWQAGYDTSYGGTAVAIAAGLFAASLAFDPAPRFLARAFSLAGLAAAAVALTMSGHASSAAPQALTKPSVFVHVMCVAFWIGALLPLMAGLHNSDRRPLHRFTRSIPYPLAALVVTGVILAVVQLDRVDALWTTNYGIVLSCKIAAVLALLTLGAVNRYVLVPRERPLAFPVRMEIGIAAAILALVALWRFTPPPRALAAAAPIEVHLHGDRAMAHVTLTPVRARDPQVDVEVFDGAFNALAVRQVTVTLANPTAGIEAIRREADLSRDNHWRAAGLRLPVAGRWTVRVDLLIDDFEKIVLEDQVDLPRLP
jgi:copper transport protein